MVIDFLAFVGLFLLVSGGYFFDGYLADKKIFVELSQWGYFLAPWLFLFLFKRERANQFLVTKLFVTLKSFYTSLSSTRQLGAGIALLVLIAALHWWGILHRYLSFRADWDLAIYANACANNMQSSFRYDMPLLADHFEPLLAAFGILCRNFDPAIVLLSVQVFCFLIGALGVLCLALKQNWSRLSAFAWAGGYLVLSKNVSALFYDFHLLGLALGFLPWLFFLMMEKRWYFLVGLCLVYCGLKETAALTIAGLGVSLFFLGERRIGGGLVIAGGVIFVVIMTIVYPYFRSGEPSMYFTKYYGYLGSDTAEAVQTLLTRPVYVLTHVLTLPKLVYVAKIFVPFLLLPFIKPIYFFALVPYFLINILSEHPLLISGNFHYEIEICAVLYLGMLLSFRSEDGTSWLNKVPWRKAWLFVFVVFLTGRAPGFQVKYYQPQDHEKLLRRTVLRETKNLPAETKIAVSEKLAPHLARFEKIYLLDRMKDADVVVLAYPKGLGGWEVSADELKDTVLPYLQTHFQKSYGRAELGHLSIWRRL